jgi:homoserine dehydrogenase
MATGVGIIGAGTVGGGVIRTLLDSRGVISANAGDDVRLAAVCELNQDSLAPFALDGVLVTATFDEMLASSEVDVVCELIGGIEPAKRFILEAIRAKKHVVTANKMLLAHHAPELTEAAVANGVELRFEAAVAGGIPIILALREGLAANRIQTIYGILNGTCNYILSRMTYEGLDFDTVLAQAQALGFAETPPDLDIDGHDTAHKCQIIASLCYHTEIDLEAIRVEGIRNITHADVGYARDMGYIIKLLAIVSDEDGELDVRVHPALVPEEHLLAAVRNEFNAVYVQADVADATLYYGRGAGRMPTASAVVADIVNIARGGRISAPFEYGPKRAIRDSGQICSRYFLRLTVRDKIGVFGEVATILGSHDVSISSCIQKEHHGDGVVHLVIMTHETVESSLRDALAVIDSLHNVVEATHVIRVLPD